MLLLKMLQMILKITLICVLHLTYADLKHETVLDSGAEVLELVTFGLGLNKVNFDVNSLWKQQLKVAIEMFIFQNTMDGFSKETAPKPVSKHSNLRIPQENKNLCGLMNSSKLYGYSINTDQEVTVAVLFDSLTSRVASEFMLEISPVCSNVNFLLYELGNSESPSGNIQLVISILQKESNNINSMLIFADNILSITTLLDTVGATRELKLTGILHTTEWVIVSNLNTDLLADLQNSNVDVDFMTVINRTPTNSTLIGQKSRNGLLTPKARVNFCRFNCQQQDKYLGQKLRDKFESFKDLRKNSRIHLMSRRSILSGMVLPVCLFPDGRHLFVRENSQNMSGYSFDLMQHMAEFLGFTTRIVLPNDSSFYGAVDPNGSATGLTGLLKNRQIAFTTMPMSRVQNRLQAIDYLHVVINDEPMVLIYRLPNHTSHLDLIYTEIFKPDFYFLLGPLLALALFGAVLHVTTRSCTLMVPEPVSKSDLRRLLSYHEHVCFISWSPYRGQAERILQASWAVTCFFLVAAYSTFLVTTFTTKPQELVINSLEKLLSLKEYKIGVHGSATAMLTMMEFSDINTELQVWTKLLIENRTDPRTFSPGLEIHAERVIAEKFVWITGNCANMGDICEKYFKPYEEDIRGYLVSAPHFLTDNYIGIPKNVFYKDILFQILTDFQEHGILRHLHNQFHSSMILERSQTSKVNNDQTQVTLKRIQLPIYAVLGGMGLGIVVLIVEKVYHWRNGNQN